MKRLFLSLLLFLLAFCGCQTQKGERVTADASSTIAAQTQKNNHTLVPTLNASWQELPPYTWTQMVFASQDVLHLAASTARDELVLYASLVNALYRSLDEGHTWQLITPPAACSGTAAKMMTHRTQSVEIYAFGSAGFDGMACAYLAYSGDQGKTWETRSLPQYHFMGGEAWPTQVVMQSHPETGAWYRFLQGSWMARASGQALAWSTNQGQSWHELLLPPSEKVTVPMYDFYGFFKTGTKWAMLVTHREGYYLSQTTGSGLGKLYYSLEDGDWEHVTLPGVLHQLVIGPDGQRAYLVLKTSPSTGNYDLYRMTPDMKIEKVGPSLGCATWCSLQDVQSGQLFWVEQRLHSTEQTKTASVGVSTDGGESWQQIPLPEPWAVYDLAIQPGGNTNLSYLYLATDNGLWVYPYADHVIPPD